MILDTIDTQARENTFFRRVLHTGTHSQLVIMSIPVGEDIGEETHPDVDQILYFVEGTCEVVLDGESRTVEERGVVYVPAGTKHNFINAGEADLKLITIYSPPEHPDGTVHETKIDAQHHE